METATAADTFELEPPTPQGTIPDRVVTELRGAYRRAKDLSTAYSEAVTAQAELRGFKAGALRRYIAALENDKLDEIDAETKDLERLIG
jgi:hypothetical protein